MSSSTPLKDRLDELMDSAKSDKDFDEIEQIVNTQDKKRMAPQVTASNSKLVYGPHNLEYFLLENFLLSKYDKDQSTHKFVEKKIWIRKTGVHDFVKAFCEQFKFTSVNREDIVFRNDDSFVKIGITNKDLDKLEIHSVNNEYAKEIEKFVEQYECSDRKISIRWLYTPDGRSMDLIETFEEKVHKEHYPFISDFDTFGERFKESKSNILLLIGEPGTGKTTFIKNLLAHMDTISYLTYDEKILNNDYTFASYMEDEDSNAFIIEDADLFLRSRADGNNMVSRFLNVGDGIVKIPNKKIIFSTNLPNIKDIDAALVRPGRCFDILHFRKLTRVESQAVADIHNIVLPGPDDKQDYTLAEIFNNPVQKPKIVARSMGFY